MNRKLTPHSMTNGNACFAYFNKSWGIPAEDEGGSADETEVATAEVEKRLYSMNQ